MKIEEIKSIAKSFDIKVGRTNKSDLVRAIQQAEGNTPCFNTTSSARCGQADCIWRDDCE